MQVADAVAAPVKRLALDHDLANPVPKIAGVVSGQDSAMDENLSPLYKPPAEASQESQVSYNRPLPHLVVYHLRYTRRLSSVSVLCCWNPEVLHMRLHSLGMSGQ